MKFPETPSMGEHNKIMDDVVHGKPYSPRPL